jgi:hypothetical protein
LFSDSFLKGIDTRQSRGLAKTLNHSKRIENHEGNNGSLYSNKLH